MVLNDNISLSLVLHKPALGNITATPTKRPHITNFHPKLQLQNLITTLPYKFSTVDHLPQLKLTATLMFAELYILQHVEFVDEN